MVRVASLPLVKIAVEEGNLFHAKGGNVMRFMWRKKAVVSCGGKGIYFVWRKRQLFRVAEKAVVCKEKIILHFFDQKVIFYF